MPPSTVLMPHTCAHCATIPWQSPSSPQHSSEEADDVSVVLSWKSISYRGSRLGDDQKNR